MQSFSPSHKNEFAEYAHTPCNHCQAKAWLRNGGLIVVNNFLRGNL